MTVIDRIVERLAKYPEVKFRRGISSLAIPPHTNDGFEVAIQFVPSEYVVTFGGWHEHFRSEDEALNCFAFGLSEDCRLRVISRGGMDCRWIVEAREGDSWLPREEVGSLLQPFFLPKRERVLQNHVIKKANQSPEPTSGLRPAAAHL